MHRSGIVLVTPALADANNGNWQTAQRWARLLAPACRVRLVTEWDPAATPRDEILMIALHARRSAASVARWRSERPDRPLVVVLTGTDLYRDIRTDASARASIEAADRLVVLNELGQRSLPPSLRPRCRVILQACAARRPLSKTDRHLRALMVGHLRAEKSPEVYFAAARRLAGRADVRLDHVGAALDPALGAAARRLMEEAPNYRWLGALPRAATRRRIQAAHLLVHPSRMEGGAHVVIEAIRSGTPVIASRIDGNVGLLGADYGGCFAPGDDRALAGLLAQARDEPAILHRLTLQCRARAPLFAPEREAAALQALLAELLPRPFDPTATSPPP